MSDQEQEQAAERKTIGRKGVLLGALGAAGAAALGTAKNASAVGNPLTLETTNYENSPTYLTALGTNDGLVGVSGRFGIFGSTPDFSITTATQSVNAPSNVRAGLLGTAQSPGSPSSSPWIGVYGVSDTIGIFGTSDPALVAPLSTTIGIYGVSAQIGVFGSAPDVAIPSYSDSVGVAGLATDSDCVGVRAENNAGGVALDIFGSVRTSRAGNGHLPAKQQLATIDDVLTTDVSAIFVQVTSPTKIYAANIERSPGSGFTIEFSRKGPTNGLDYCWIAVEPNHP